MERDNKFAIGDKVQGNDSSLTRYNMTRKGNGYGIVVKLLDEEGLIHIKWIDLEMMVCGTFQVNQDFFEPYSCEFNLIIKELKLYLNEL